jgi:hypothetical protein
MARLWFLPCGCGPDFGEIHGFLIGFAEFDNSGSCQAPLSTSSQLKSFYFAEPKAAEIAVAILIGGLRFVQIGAASCSGK